MNLRLPLIAGNWKLNHGPTATREFFRDFLEKLPSGVAATVVVCPPSVSLTTAAEALRGRDDVLLGVQNVHWEAEGAFTGEISAPLARDAGAVVVLVGHSERRHVFGETDEESGRKVKAALHAGMVAVLCVGETLADREADRAFATVERQLKAGLDSVTPDDLERLVIAYEPVWAIGTGRTASPQDASEMHGRIQQFLKSSFADGAEAIPILYGGSVKADNAASLLAAPGVGGLLIGGASLDPAGFASICSLGS